MGFPILFNDMSKGFVLPTSTGKRNDQSGDEVGRAESAGPLAMA